MKKITSLLVITLIIISGLVGGAILKEAHAQDDKDIGNSLPDPDRNYFDGNGNEYNYKGELISPAPKPAQEESATTMSNCH